MEDAKKRVLLVDDEADITYIVEFILAQSDIEVDYCNDSRQAVPKLLEKDYSLLILDLMMPHLSGFEVLQEVRKQEKLKGLPIMILSSRQLSPDETSLIDSMHANMMSKPFEPHRLLEKVREIIAD